MIKIPNWNSNSVEIMGPAQSLQEITEKVNEAESLLEALYPLPGEWDHAKAIAHWGCKWSDEISRPMECDGKTASVQFPTPWGPPLAGLQAISRQYPLCTFGIAYHEEGMCFYGMAIYRNGKDCVSEEGDLPNFGDFEEDEDKYRENELEFIADLYTRMELEVIDAHVITKGRILL